MKAPKCYRCEGRHWSTQPCPAINKPRERLTDAINFGPVAINTPAPKGTLRMEPGMGEKDSHAPPAEAAVAADARTPNRRSRADYNTYMKDYMAWRRN